MDSNIIPPSKEAVLYSNIKKSQNKVFDEMVHEDEEVWVAFGRSPFYSRLKRYINTLIENLDKGLDTALENGATQEEIGARTIINRLSASNLRSIINKVEQTTQSSNDRQGK